MSTETPRRPRPLRARPEAEAEAEAEAIPPAAPPASTTEAPPERPSRSTRDPRVLIGNLREVVGPAGLLPIALLLALSAAERFDFAAYSVLGPEIRHTFHLSNQTYLTVTSGASVFALLMTVPIGYLADKTHRIRLAQVGGLLWAFTALGTGLAPVFALFFAFRIAGGIGLTVNQPVHNSLFADYYPPRALAPVFSFYLLAFNGVNLIAGPVAGGISAAFGWRFTFILLALPTFVMVAALGRLREPARGESLGLALGEEERPSMAEGFRRLRAIRSLKRTWWAAAFFGGGVIAFVPLLSLFFEDVYREGPFARGVIASEFGLAALVGIAIGGPLAQRQVREDHPERLPVVNGLMAMLFGAGIIVMAASPWLAGSLVGVFALSVGAAGLAPAYTTMVALVAPPRLRAQAYSYTTMFIALGAAFVAPTIGGLGDAHGQRVAALVLGALVGMAGAVELTARRWVRRDIVEARKMAAASSSSALLACRGVDVSYEGGVQVLFGVDFEVERGAVIALLGTNGAGKSTLLRTISGLLDPISGAIFYNGRDITHADAVTKVNLGIVQVPGGRGVFPGLTVAENLKIAGWMYRRDGAYLKDATERVLDHFPVLRQLWDVPAANLSGGQQQMLTLAQALLARPTLLMIDELTLGLAPVVVEQLLQTVRRLADDGTTIILVEQSVNLALTVADTAYFMEKGEIRFHGPTTDLLARPDILRAVFLGGGAGPPSSSPPTPAAPVGGGDRRSRIAAGGNGAAPGDAPLPVLSIAQVSKRFGGIYAVNDVSIDIAPRQIVGIIGPNGAGKTTVFDLVSGYTSPDGGRIVLGGADVTAFLPDLRARCGLGRSFQDAKLFPGLTVFETVALALEGQVAVRDPIAAALHLPAVADSEAAIARRADELIELMGLGAFRDKFVSELSTGSRRILDLACILAHDPDVILFDEPSSGIAQRETEALAPLLLRVRDTTGASLLVIEHDMPLITSIADEIVAMDLGSVIARGPAAEVIRDPAVVASYLGSAPEAITRSGGIGVFAATPPAPPPRARRSNGRSNSRGSSHAKPQ